MADEEKVGFLGGCCCLVPGALGEESSGLRTEKREESK